MAERENAALGAESERGASETVSRMAGADSSEPSTVPTGDQRAIVLRPYQERAVSDLRRAIGHGAHRPLLAAPTGGGKTIIAASIVERAVAKGSRVLFLAHRRELIEQAARKLYEAAGLDAGVIMAGYPHRPDQPVQIASVQTLHQRAIRTSAIDAPDADVVIVDEAHRARAQTYQEIIEAYPSAVVLGLTATPCRGDGKGLGNVFDELVETPAVEQMVADGYLVPTVVYAPSTPELTGVETRHGDYVESQLAERVDTPELVGDVVTHWLRLASDRKTVCFATGVQHSVHLRDEFRRNGVVAEHIDGSTPTEEREDILARLSDGRVQVVTNCLVLTEGWDQPDVSCCILARPTKHMGLYRQMVGRVLRPAPGKADALVLDHAGSTHQHGFVEEPVEWTLDTDKRAENKRNQARKTGEAPSLKDCPECGAVRKAGSPCTACGWRPREKADAPEVAEGELSKVERDGTAQRQTHDKGAWFRQLLCIARQRGYKDGWAAHKYREKFGQFPKHRKAPETPSPEVQAWVRSRQIAYAKAKKKKEMA